ncbi:M48 family metallopeptidase [Paucibacter soli]|uniref:M48 family metallopeptidase n=1 Tax=Paucibacter soli TaxID=3133433 RepID=UPI0030B68E5D
MAPRLQLDYFDGRSARPQRAEIQLLDGRLHLDCGLQQHQYPLRRVRWPERQRHGQRQALLPDGGVLSCADAALWDDWARASGLRDSLTVRWMQNWRLAGTALALLLAMLLLAWRWGVPLATEAALRWLPPALEQQIGAQTLAQLESHWLRPSQLPPAEQEGLRQRFAALVAQAHASGQAPAYQLHFRAASDAFGPNAFALPGGAIVLTDALVLLMRERPDAVLGVLAHELGHVRQRHGLRLAVQASLLSALAGLVVGDFSTLLAGMPALLTQQAYSRDFEREADAEARRCLLAAGISPRVMLDFFERLARERQHAEAASLPIAFSSHPADAERKRFFGADSQ